VITLGLLRQPTEEGEGVYGDASCSGNPGVAVPSGVAGGAGAGAGAGPLPLDVYVAAASNTVQCQMQASKQVDCDYECQFEQNAPTVHACYKVKGLTATFCLSEARGRSNQASMCSPCYALVLIRIMHCNNSCRMLFAWMTQPLIVC